MTIEEQIAEVEREIGFRAKTFPRYVESGKLTKAAAQEHTDRILAVLYTLRRVRDQHIEIVPGYAEIRRGAHAEVLALVTPHVHSSTLLQIEKKLRNANEERKAHHDLMCFGQGVVVEAEDGSLTHIPLVNLKP